MILSSPSGLSKKKVFDKVRTFLQEIGLHIIRYDEERPWGGFFVLDENQTEKFINLFFNEVAMQGGDVQKLSPKILIVEPGKRLSWQYHFRRAELWKVIEGEVGVIVSDTDAETDLTRKKVNDLIRLRQGERHRLIGLNDWGIIAEIWQHVDTFNPSDEEDIVRLQDDFGR